MSDASEFLDALAGDSLVTFQTFDDSSNKRRNLSCIAHGTLAEREQRLRQLNEKGAGVFVMVNEGDGCGRRTENVRSVRALFVDLDGAPLEPVLQAPILPHVTCESSPGRFHAYWLVDQFPLDDFPHFQNQLAARFNADPKVKDLPRVMRLPGFDHRKGSPFTTRLLSASDEPKRHRDEFADAFGIKAAIRKGERNDRLFKAAAGLRHSGLPRQATKRRVEAVNAAQCERPLSGGEINAVIESTYRYTSEGVIVMPFETLDRVEFEDLSPAAAKLLLCAERRGSVKSSFTLIWDDYSHMAGFAKRTTFRAAVEELIDGGFVELVSDYIAGTEKGSRAPAYYRVRRGTARGTVSTYKTYVKGYQQYPV